ncbi:MAG: glycosyltransferase family 39 protein [Gammaproteobacteria bacterium]|nr:glycosyltransferase family 39 protein [Gammaproteobacteria bacterium]MDH3559422.1 glycosyltransferase family 39 protein [Gammaproteobacteria bacterium]
MPFLTPGGTLAWRRPWFGAFADVLRISGRRFGLKRQEDSLWVVLISLCALTTLLGLYILRSLDDNRLTSWWWVFDSIAPFAFFLMLVAGILLAYGISRLSLRGRAAVPLLFMAAFLITAGLWQQPEVIVDAARHFMQAKYLELHGIGYFLMAWGNDIPAWTDLPLAPLIHGLIFQVFGESRVAVQVFTSLLFSGTVVLTYLIGKTLWSRDLGLYAGMLLLGMPYLLTQVPLMMVDVAAMFFLTLAVFTTVTAVARGGPVLCVMATVAITLAMLAKYSNWLMLSVVPIIALVHARLGWKVVFLRAAAVAAGVLVLMGIFLYAKFDVVAGQISLLHSYQVPALGRWGESLLSTFFFQIHPFVTLAAVLSVYLAVKKKDVKYAIIGWMLLVVMVLDLRRIRYMLVVLPMLALMAAYGLETIKCVEYRKFIAANAVVTAALIVAVGYFPFFQSTSANNIKQAGEYLDSIHAGTAEVHVLPQTTSSVNPAVAVPMLDLFTDQQLVYHADMGTAHAAQAIAELPWRWTWEVGSPEYLPPAGTSGPAPTIVVIQSEANQPVPDYLAKRIDGYNLQKEFTETSRVFRFRTIVRIYRRA